MNAVQRCNAMVLGFELQERAGPGFVEKNINLDVDGGTMSFIEGISGFA